MSKYKLALNGHKVCKVCEEDKPLSEFQIYQHRILMRTCKKCYKEVNIPRHKDPLSKEKEKFIDWNGDGIYC